MATLYFLAGACSLVPHIVARELELGIDTKAAPRAGEGGREEYIKNVNALGSVPALMLDNGTCLTQNLAIVEYLVGQGESKGKVGVAYPKLGTLEHAEALRWLSFANSDVHPCYGPLFRPQAFSSDSATHDELKKLAKERLDRLYTHADAAYANKNWIANNQFSAADVYLYVTLRWAKAMGINIEKWANLSAMIKRIENRPAVQKSLSEQGIEAIAVQMSN